MFTERVCEQGPTWEICVTEPNYLMFGAVALAFWLFIAVVTARMK